MLFLMLIFGISTSFAAEDNQVNETLTQDTISDDSDGDIVSMEIDQTEISASDEPADTLGDTAETFTDL